MNPTSMVVVAFAAVEPKVVGANQVPTPSPVAVIAPQLIVPEASVVSARVVPQAPKLPMVVLPMLDTAKSVVVPVCVDDPIANKVVLVAPLFA